MVDEDDICNPSKNQHFNEVLAARLSRRSVLKGGLAALALGGIGSLVKAMPAAARGRGSLLGFTGIPVSSADTVVVPKGYTARVLIAWGDPIADGPEFRQDASNTAADQALQWGMHNDGVVYFPIDGSRHGLLVQNHEYTDEGLLFTDGIANWNAEKTNKSLNAHGVSVIEIRKDRDGRRGRGHGNDDDWHVVSSSKYRAAHHRADSDPDRRAGRRGSAAAHERGSRRPRGARHAQQLRHGLHAVGHLPGLRGELQRVLPQDGHASALGQRQPARAALRRCTPFGLWHQVLPSRTAVQRRQRAQRAQPLRLGGRDRSVQAHLDAGEAHCDWAASSTRGRGSRRPSDGRIVVYMGDDERNEYIYRFVSQQPWRQAVRRGVSPLDDGTLYVARFNADGTGEWLPLTPDNPPLATWTLADISINTRAAADRGRGHDDGPPRVDRHVPGTASP